MAVYHETFKIQSDRRVTFHDVTDDVQRVLERSGIRNGTLMVYSQHTTCSVLIQERSFEEDYTGTELLMRDLLTVLESVIPTCRTEGQYRHPGPKIVEIAVKELGEQPFMALNTDAHLRSVVLGRSETVPVSDGALMMGQYGRFWFVDFDQTRARERTVWVQVMGERGSESSN
jgi:thiamine phosphate synthase YjbQ (UPF0047 family)